MRDHHGSHAVVLQVRMAALRQRSPHAKLHVLAVDLRHLLEIQRPLRSLRQARHARKQILHAYLPSHISNVVTRCSGLSGNRAPRAQHHDFFCFHLHPSKNWLRIQLLY